MKPVGKYVLLDVKKKETNSKIIIPEEYKKKEKRGKLLAKGNFVNTDLSNVIYLYFVPAGIKETEAGLFVPERSIMGIGYE